MARNTRRAFTLIEALVVVAIVAIVSALAIPAIMGARESARRTQCQNQLKQIGLAVNSHLTQKNHFPQRRSGYSLFVPLLPFLEQSSLYNSINMSNFRAVPESPGDINYTAFSTRLLVFVCPSNDLGSAELGPITYAGNLGYGVSKTPFPINGPFASNTDEPVTRESMIRDGLSNTVAISEFCRIQANVSPNNRHAILQVGAYTRPLYNTMIADCIKVDITGRTVAPIARGECWGHDDWKNTLYDHGIVPNGNTCACKGGDISGAWTAGSNHSDGANCLHLDGHVSFVNTSISVQTWRSIGTMNGGEITDTVVEN